MPKTNKTILERLLAKITLNERTDCWEWNGYRNEKGYGQMSLPDRNVKAHRLSYELHKGEIPKGLLVCHECDNPPCCNPDHLFLGTHLDNRTDAINKGRVKTVSCPSNSAYNKGCRCDECRLLHNEYAKKRAKVNKIKK